MIYTLRVTISELQARYDVVIVGSGHNALVAAAYLSRAGKSVLVLEKNEMIGGATASERVFPDFDALLSRYSYLISLFPQRIAQDLNLNFRLKRRDTASFTPYRHTDGTDRGLILSNVDESRSRESMKEMTGSEDAWGKYQDLLRMEASIANVLWPSLTQPLRSKLDFESHLSPEEREAWTCFVEEPLGRALERFAQHDALRGLLLTDGKIGVFTHAHDPSLLQNRCFLYHVIGGGTGEWQVPVGGMKALVDSLLGVCTGVDFVCGASCQHVELGANTHTVTFENDGRLQAVDATHVLVNASPRTFAKLFDTPWQPDPAGEGSVVKINMLLRRLPKMRAKGVSSQEAFSGSFHIDEGYTQMETSYRAAKAGEMPNPVPGEIYCHTLTDPTILSPDLARAGYHTLTLFGLDMPYRLFEADNEGAKKQALQRYLEGLDRMCAEPFADCLAVSSDGEPCLEIKSPLDLEEEVGLDQGNIFHSELSWFWGEGDEVGTWGVETRYPRVLLCGSGAKRGGAVSGIPGFAAAQALLQGF